MAIDIKNLYLLDLSLIERLKSLSMSGRLLGDLILF